MLRDNIFNILNKLIIIFFCLIYLAGAANETVVPDYNRFQERLSLAIIFVTSIYILSKLSINFLKSFLSNNKIVKRMLEFKIVEYSLILCISTISFYIIGWGFYTNEYWSRDMLIDIIIICFIAFFLDATMLSGYKKIRSFFDTHRIKFNIKNNI